MAKPTPKTRVKKKRWYKLVAPKMFKEEVVGETHLYDPEAMLGRKMSMNMMNLTGHPRDQQAHVKLRIREVREGKGMLEVIGYEMMPSTMKRIVRRDRSKIEDSIVVATSDKKKVRIKPLLITNTRANKSVKKSIRLSVRNKLAEFAAKINFVRLAEEILSSTLQKHIGNAASEIAPIKKSEIKAFILVEKEGVKITKPAKVKIKKKTSSSDKEKEEKPEAKEKKDEKAGANEEKKRQEPQKKTGKPESKEEKKEEKKKSRQDKK